MPTRAPGDQPDPAGALVGRREAEPDGDDAPGDEQIEQQPPPSRVRAPRVDAPTDVDFPPRTAVRRVVGVLTVVAVAATGVAGYLAYADTTPLTVGVAVALGVVALALWLARAGSTPAHLVIRGGQLEVVRGSTREVFDLTSRFTRMEIVGTPGQRGWKVLMARFGREPLVINASMVDPVAFTAAVERLRSS